MEKLQKHCSVHFCSPSAVFVLSTVFNLQWVASTDLLMLERSSALRTC